MVPEEAVSRGWGTHDAVRSEVHARHLRMGRTQWRYQDTGGGSGGATFGFIA